MANNISLPVGFQFSPTDEELLGLFLSQRENLPPFYPIQVADVYADKEPWLLFDKDVQQIHYVFVELKRKTNKSKMAKRTAGCGTWSGQNAAKPVEDCHGQLLGFKKLLIFEFPNDAGDNGHWIMHEYSSTKKNDAYVICAIRNKQLDNIVEPATNATKKRSLQKHAEIHPSKRACNSVQFGSTNQGAIEEIGNHQKANPTEASRLLQISAAQSNLLSGDVDVRFNLSNQGSVEGIGNQQKENLTETEACRSLQPSTAQSNPLSGDVDVQFNFNNQGAIEETRNQQKANLTEWTESEVWRLLQDSATQSNPSNDDVDVVTLLDTNFDWRPFNNFGDEPITPLDDIAAIQPY